MSGARFDAIPNSKQPTIIDVLANRVAGDFVGQRFLATDDNGGQEYAWDGGSWLKCGPAVNDPRLTKLFTFPHGWIISGPISVPAGDSNIIPPFRVPTTGMTVKLAKVEYRLGNGAVSNSVTFSFQRNGASAVDLTGLVAGGGSNLTNWAEIDNVDISLSNNDILAPLVTATAGSPKNLSIVAYLTYQV